MRRHFRRVRCCALSRCVTRSKPPLEAHFPDRHICKHSRDSSSAPNSAPLSSSPLGFYLWLRPGSEMDVIPMCSIFQELQIVHDTGYFSALPSLEEYWQQVTAPLTSLETRTLTDRLRARDRRAVWKLQECAFISGKLARTDRGARTCGCQRCLRGFASLPKE